MRTQVAVASGSNTTGVVVAPSNNPAQQRALKAKAAAKAALKSSSTNADQALVDELSAKFASKIRVVSSRKAEGDKTTHKDKADRATVEQVLDPRTRIILFKMLNNQTLSQVNGCISTGKEANVYHASTPDGQHRAIKVYKTSILVFKDRDRYVTGEFRYRNGYAKSNPRKMVKMWAEKEMRNLKRLVVAGIPCPEPYSCECMASPRLKDAVINDPMNYKNLYLHLVKMVWKMYHKCKLVHADLSEYNILYHNKTLYIIDVSQSVEHDHPHALEFLRKDLQNVVDYFSNAVDVFTLRELFDYTVTTWDIVLKTVVEQGLCAAGADEDSVLDAYTAYMHTPKARMNIQEVAASKGEAVFKQAYIPRTLQEIKVQRGQVDVNSGVGAYGRVTGAGPQDKGPFSEENDEESDEDEDDSDDDDDDEEDEDGSIRLKKDEEKDAKKARKQAAKEEKREKRLTKMPKAVKKRKQKVTSNKK
ncbi:RIO1-domain-containing protein [Rhizoclosmatium globosum]|uniref:Serine/threonine-protein kinase RIO1 n=1 Tax=Rhizoclosmatium globosum TaxID=329046 RepID=A0A1Y2CBP6_9FUNG|nr:RIO1-domain-containing protein [Rhizoclosmatium globosum]|eukprot:ORY43755.1 RIO1-domain-containing protein [Rhizoclosmatium globosum]